MGELEKENVLFLETSNDFLNTPVKRIFSLRVGLFLAVNSFHLQFCISEQFFDAILATASFQILCSFVELCSLCLKS